MFQIPNILIIAAAAISRESHHGMPSDRADADNAFGRKDHSHFMRPQPDWNLLQEEMVFPYLKKKTCGYFKVHIMDA